MKKYLVFCGMILSVSSFAQVTSTEQQIKEATLALPEADRANAKIWGYNADGELVMLQKGGSGYVCLADDPNKKGFSVSCYHQDLEPFMARGRELQKENKSFKEVFDIREAEAKKGKLKMPKNPSTLHILSGESLEKANHRYVVYIPWATAASTGLPLKEVVPGAPWIMDPGTHRAHIMISPPAKK
jgi:hypothetical protein